MNLNGEQVLIVDPDNENRYAKFDSILRAPVVILAPHHAVHAKRAFHLQLSSGNLGAETNDHLHITFKTANLAKRCHMLALGYGSGEVLFSIREAPTGGLAGSPVSLSIRNRDREAGAESLSGNTEVASAKEVGTGGILLVNEYLGAGVNKQVGESRGIGEWILKRNTIYSFRIYATTAITATLTLEWYEAEPE